MNSSGNSSDGGYLAPVSVSYTQSDLLDIVLKVIAGITSLPQSNIIRLRLQTQPIWQYLQDTNWCTFGFINIDNQATEAISNANELSSKNLQTLRINFFGPSCVDNALNFKDGLFIDQNRAKFDSILGYVPNVTINIEQEIINNGAVLRGVAIIDVEFNSIINKVYDILSFVSTTIHLYSNTNTERNINI